MSQRRYYLEYGSDAVALALTGITAALFLATGAELFRRIASPVAAPVDLAPVAPAPAPPDAEFTMPPSPAPAIAPPSETHPDQDAQYAGELRADIDRRTHPPDSAEYRLLHPAGEARVQFVVARSGEPRSVMLLRSSGSRILDEAAIDTVRSGHYPPMPAKAFAGETEHVFVVTIEYRRNALAMRTR